MKKIKQKKITVDLVIFQLQRGKPLGISRIWGELLPRLIRLMPDTIFDICLRSNDPEDIQTWLFLREAGNPNVHVYCIEEFQWGMESVNARGSDLFISTYYTYSPHCKNLLYIYDMIPEQLGWTGPEWDAKHMCMGRADKMIAMSNETLKNLSTYSRVTTRDMSKNQVVYGGVDGSRFYPANASSVLSFRKESGLLDDYVMLSGRRGLYKNGETIFPALQAMPEAERPSVLVAGGEYVGMGLSGLNVVYVDHMDDEYLRDAYSGALCLYYPSEMEGFGLPVLEAMACGCPVILGTAPVFSEFAVGHVLNNPRNAQDVIGAINHIKTPSHRLELVERGLQAAKKKTWDASATLLKESIEECWK